MWKRSLILIGAGLFAVVALGIGSRALNELSGQTVRTDGVVRVGIVGDFRRRHSTPAAEMLAGVRLWRARIAETQGIPYNDDRVAAVRLLVENDRGSPVTASQAVRNLVNRGATVLFGPPDSAELAAVADVAMLFRIPLLSPIPRPLTIPRSSLFTFLDRARIGDFSAAFDALDVATRGTRRGRVLILTIPGEWGLEARRNARLARERGYVPEVVQVTEGITNALSVAEQKPLQAVFVSAPFRLGLGWFLAAKPTRAVPWVLAAPDVRSAMAASSRTRVAISVPWSPMTQHGGEGFSPGEFTQAYGDAYGRLPTIDAAAGAALGIVVSQAVQLARSTDANRVLAARDRIDVDSVWGKLSFVNGENDSAYPQAVLLDGSGPRAITADRSGARRLKASIPPKTATIPASQ
jgi:ABC-type branched-subunit amino acid transport system substrate-binding protein